MYTVYVVSLEPILLAFEQDRTIRICRTDGLDERVKVCRILGKFTHATKPRIQIDQFFTEYFLDLLKQSGRDFPEDISEAITRFEKAEKLNPTMD